MRELNAPFLTVLLEGRYLDSYLSSAGKDAPRYTDSEMSASGAECVGGAHALNETDLTRAYRTYLDPRLNYEQALELAFFTARKMRLLNGRTASRAVKEGNND